MQRKRFNYKGVSTNMFGVPFGRQTNRIDGLRFKRSIHAHPISSSSLRRRDAYLHSFNSGFPKYAPKDLLLMYDIPHKRKKDRDWFRRQLKNLGFIMIQKSVWVGPSPLPPAFKEYVKNIALDKNFMTFKLAKPYAVSLKIGH